MSQILNKLRDVDPNNSEAIKEVLSPFFQQLSKHTEVNCGLWLKALESTITRFPKYCISQRANIESYLAHFLDCTNYYVVIEAAKCAHALQQVRPTQEKTATSKYCWREQMNALCSTVHSLLGAMFPDAVDIYQQMGKTQKEQQSPASPLSTALSQLCLTTAKNNAALNKQILLNTRLRNVFVFIQAMLVEIYPVAKPVRPQTILNVILRALSVTSSNNVSQNLEVIVCVKTQALRTLDALIACLGPNLIPYSPLVFRFAMQTLKWSSDNPSEQSSAVRRAAYRTVSAWLSALTSLRPAARARAWPDHLADHILADITRVTHTVQLQMSSQPMKNLSKKAKRKLANSMMMESNISSHMPGEKNKMAAPEEFNEDVAIAALECAEIFFTVCGMFLKPTTHKRFQERLVRNCYSLEDYSAPLALTSLRALEAARKATPPTVPPHTHIAMQLYSSIHSPNVEISNFCAQALLDIRMHLHCAPPTLSFAMQVEPDTSREEKKKQISEKNRAALEELLGTDKVPKQTEKVVHITIPDEPSNKKRKVEVEESDKISLSSDSTSSIEISDDTDAEECDVKVVEVVTETVENEEIHPDEEVDIMPTVEEIDSVNSKESDVEIEFKNGKTKTMDITEDDIHNQATQLPNAVIGKDVSEDKVDSTQSDENTDAAGLKMPSEYEATTLPPNATIYDATKQLPFNISNEDEDETPLSMEVAYDFPNTGKEKVNVLDKLDGDNLPSTNETDDIQITCGQVAKNSQDIDIDAKKSDIDNKISEVKVNGIGDTTDKPVQNGDVTESGAVEIVVSKDLNVEDMLADFVDEVNDDTQATQVY